MALEPIVFGVVLTVISIGNHLFYSEKMKTQSAKRFAAHTEYVLGSTLLLFSAPFSVTIVSAFVCLALAIGLYMVLVQFAPTTRTLSSRGYF